MKPITVAALLVLVAPSTLAQDGTKEHSVTLKKLAVGDVVLEGMKGVFHLDQTMTSAGTSRSSTLDSELSAKHRWTVLAVDGKGVSKVGLRVIEYVEKNTTDGEVTTHEGDESGKAFVVTRSSSGIDVAADGEFEVGESATKYVKEALHDGKGSLVSASCGLESLLARKNFVEATPVVLKGESVARMLGSFADDMPLESVTFTPKEARSSLGTECLVFELATRLEETEDGETFTLEATGEVVVRKRDGWVQSLTFSGPLTASGGDEHARMEGSGTMNIKLLSFFEKDEKAEKK